jgi:hypothetical protein
VIVLGFFDGQDLKETGSGRYVDKYDKDTPYYKENDTIYRQVGDNRGSGDKIQEVDSKGNLRDKY